MGIGVSSWPLARAVAQQGQLGVVSGTALDNLLVRRLQDGDIGGHIRRAMEAFPSPAAASETLRNFFNSEGREEGEPYALVPMYRQAVDSARDQLTILANFVEVWLAKEGHDGTVGINFLSKVQMPTLPSLYGAMLAGVDYVLMGAGIPREIPGALDSLANHEPASIRFDVAGPSEEKEERLSFDPREFIRGLIPSLTRPKFLPIISSNSLATMLARKANGRVDGFVVEGPTAGGHNAPPRGEKRLNERGEPVYGERDSVDLKKLAKLGLPFWVAGGTGRPGTIKEARADGGVGIQVGTLFAYCRESGLVEGLKRSVLEMCSRGEVEVKTEDRASPTGFPFKTVDVQTSLTCEETYESRKRVCDLGYLRVPFRKDDGNLGYRCPAEPVRTFLAKGGSKEDTEGRKCLCNALLANVGHAQSRGDGVEEAPLLTSGDDLKTLKEFLGGRDSYTARDVIDYLLS
ncbi:MAG: nitronate monooxygenase [Gemmatimonadetes bacterium]|nr:nitronate monooxygenase [Gemmatimonadota bacterium]NNM04737.1 nitronate monooxygenase [Gemmatimonadota bacterium]